MMMIIMTIIYCCAWQELGQRALVSYMRSVFLQPNKAVFADVAALPVADFAAAALPEAAGGQPR